MKIILSIFMLKLFNKVFLFNCESLKSRRLKHVLPYLYPNVCYLYPIQLIGYILFVHILRYTFEEPIQNIMLCEGLTDMVCCLLACVYVVVKFEDCFVYRRLSIGYLVSKWI